MVFKCKYAFALGAAVAGLLKLLWSFFRMIVFRKKEKDTPQLTDGAQQNWEADWQDFSVSVIPNPSVTSMMESACREDSKVQCDDVVNEVLNEMQPVLKRTKMVSCNTFCWFLHTPLPWTYG